MQGDGTVEWEGTEEGGFGSAPLLLKASLAYAKRGVLVFSPATGAPREPADAKRPLGRHHGPASDRAVVEGAAFCQHRASDR